MHIVNRTIALGVLLALVAPDAHAWGKKKKATPPPPEPAPVVVAPPPPPPPPPTIYFGDAAAIPQVASLDFVRTTSSEVQSVAQWVTETRDNANLYFLVLDKVNAQVYFFHPKGYLMAAAPVLLGMGKGDRMLVPNTAPMSAIPPHKRITPAGRFVSRLGIDSHGKELLILDYDAALSLHPIVKGTPKENRAGRMASPTAEDNRISFGCINVPVAFYETVVSPALTNTKGIVYVLPETSSAAAMFGFQPTGIATAGTSGTPATIAPATTAPASAAIAPAAIAPATIAPSATVSAPAASTAVGTEAAQAAPSPGAK